MDEFIQIRIRRREKLPSLSDDELLVLTRGRSHEFFIGVRGELDWSHVVHNLLPLTKYKIKFRLRAETVCYGGIIRLAIALL